MRNVNRRLLYWSRIHCQVSPQTVDPFSQYKLVQSRHNKPWSTNHRRRSRETEDVLILSYLIMPSCNFNYILGPQAPPLFAIISNLCISLLYVYRIYLYITRRINCNSTAYVRQSVSFYILSRISLYRIVWILYVCVCLFAFFMQVCVSRYACHLFRCGKKFIRSKFFLFLIKRDLFSNIYSSKAMANFVYAILLIIFKFHL